MSPTALAHLQAFLTEVAKESAREAVREVLSEKQAPKFATGKNNPFGDREKFLAACRKGAFPVKRVGRENWAEWSDVEAYIRGRLPPKRKESAVDGLDMNALMEMATTPKRSRRAR
ncbi:hypothetical protein WMF38_56800 [Sorangium sp. So ce118]